MTRIEIDNLALAITADLMNTGTPRQGTHIKIYCHEGMIGERSRNSTKAMIAKSIARCMRERRANTRKAAQ